MRGPQRTLGLLRTLYRPLCTAAAPEEPAMKAIAAFTSDMRPPGDTSRKWVKVDPLGRAYATGRRKAAVARVWVWPSEDCELATVRINKTNLSSFFGGHWVHRHTVLSPFFVTDTAGQYNVMATVKGGGISGAFACAVAPDGHIQHILVSPCTSRRHAGQAEAVRHGIATAMQGLDATLRPVLKKAGFMTRDARVRERKKPGQKGARKKFACARLTRHLRMLMTLSWKAFLC